VKEREVIPEYTVKVWGGGLSIMAHYDVGGDLAKPWERKRQARPEFVTVQR
jgi:hypothetical protein